MLRVRVRGIKCFLSHVALRIEHVHPVQFHNRTFTFFGLDIQESETNMNYKDGDDDREVVFLPSSLSEAIQGEHILNFI